MPTASAGVHLHPQSCETTRELLLHLVDLGRRRDETGSRRDLRVDTQARDLRLRQNLGFRHFRGLQLRNRLRYDLANHDG